MRSRCHIVLSALLLAACKDVTDYSTGPDESFCGNVVQGAFVRAGFKPNVQLRLRFNGDSLDANPGLITTSDGLFLDTPLLVIPQLAHDPLSTLQFGEGRRRNLLYTAMPRTTGAAVTVILSLMENGDVEVRLLRGAAPAASADAPPEALFGVFPLRRRQGTCGL